MGGWVYNLQLLREAYAGESGWLLYQSGHSHTFRYSSGETTENDVKNSKNAENRILGGILKTLKYL